MGERQASRVGLRSRMKTEASLAAIPQSPSSKQSGNRATKSVVERLQALRTDNELTQEKILQEALPNQKSVLLAAPLFDSPRKNTAPRTGFTRQGQQQTTRRRHARQQRLLAPLPADQAPVSSREHEHVEVLAKHPSRPAETYGDHALHIWEDKFAHHKLKIEDALYLLMHDELIAVVESAVLLKASGMTSDQLLEVEMAIEQLACVSPRSPMSSMIGNSRCGSRFMARATMFRKVFENVWSHGCAFRCELNGGEVVRVAPPLREQRVLSPVKSPLHRRPGTRGEHPISKQSESKKNKPAGVELLYSSSTNQNEFKRLSSDLKCSHDVLAVHTRDVLQSSRWIQENCVQEMMSRNSELFHKMRKEKAAQIIMDVIVTRANRTVAQHFQSWRVNTLATRCQQLVMQYLHLKGAAKILILARRLQKRSFLWRWHRWLRRLNIERKMERLAGTVTIQSWARCVLAKHKRKTFHIERAATTLQSSWRGYHTRKMLRRRRRYEAYTTAACVVQRSYRAHYNRCQFAIHWARQKASCCITRSLRQYCARRRMFKSWCHRVARFHSAALIQLWMRQTLQRIRNERNLWELQTSAAFTMQRFFRFARFMNCFGSRVKRLMQRKNAAAVKLQNAYRAKQARARFYALKDQLEAQRRQEILQMMWDNAYATTIQRSWRKKRLWRLQHYHQNVHESTGSVDGDQLQASSEQSPH